MSRIKITETTTSTPITFEATDNVVLLPLYIQATAIDGVGSETAGDPTLLYTTQYTSANAFQSRYENCVARYQDTSLATTDKSVSDKTYFMAVSLLNLGLKVIVKPLKAPAREGQVTHDFESESAIADSINTAITNGCYTEFESHNQYNVKFITSGAYYNLKVAPKSGAEGYDITGCYSTLSSLAYVRGDAVALVELSDNITTGVTEGNNVNILTALGNISSMSNSSYCACAYPCGTYGVSNTTKVMPGAYGYLTAYANSVVTYPNWYAAAGITRGKLIGLSAAKYEVTEALADILSGISKPTSGSLNVCVNPITNFGSYGYRVFGNRTMLRETVNNTVTQFLNVRMLVCDIKKQIYDAAVRVTFEPNDDITFINFKSSVNVLLDKMKTGRGIEWYTWSYKAAEQSGTIAAKLKLKPIEAVEQFDIDIELTDSDLVTTESESI